jgi:hypothetical protein
LAAGVLAGGVVAPPAGRAVAVGGGCAPVGAQRVDQRRGDRLGCWLAAGGCGDSTPLERAVTGWPVVVVRAEGGVVSALCLLGSG